MRYLLVCAGLIVLGAGVAGCSSAAYDANVDTGAAFQAAEYGDYSTVALALGNGLSINDVDAQGMTLLHHAVLGDQPEMVLNLIEKHPGADVNIQDTNGRTALSYAEEIQNGWIIQVLQTAGAQ